MRKLVFIEHLENKESKSNKNDHRHQDGMEAAAAGEMETVGEWAGVMALADCQWSLHC